MDYRTTFRKLTRWEVPESASLNIEDAFRRAKPLIVVNLLVATLFAVTLLDLVPSAALIQFLFATLVATVIRTTVVTCYWRLRERFSLQFWINAFVTSLAISGASWGIFSLILAMQADEIGQIVIMFYLTSITLGGSAAFHALSLGAATGYRNTLLIASRLTIAITACPVMVYMLVVASGPRFLLAIGMLLAMVQSARSSTLVHHVFNSAIARSVTDIGSGLLNRRGFFEQLRESHASALLNSNEKRWCILMIDIDHFKQINDRYGHAFGDEVIAMMGKVLHAVSSDDAISGRLGGEEFAILLASPHDQHAREFAESIRENYAARCLAMRDEPFNSTCSIGISTPMHTDKTPDETLSEADRMLYQAKQAGRDRVMFAALH